MEGYMENARGHQVPLDQVKEIDRVRHELVLEKVELFRAMRQELRDLKADTMGDIEAFVQLSGEKYGVKVGGDKGNITLMSYDGKYQIKRQISEHLAFGEQLQAAKELIDECIKEWTQGSRTELRALINDAFQVDKEGRINTGRILGLRRLKIDDERWARAMDAISDSLQVVGSKAYVRIYERNADGSYSAVALDMAKV
jgi:hypothetical protein